MQKLSWVQIGIIIFSLCSAMPAKGEHSIKVEVSSKRELMRLTRKGGRIEYLIAHTDNTFRALGVDEQVVEKREGDDKIYQGPQAFSSDSSPDNEVPPRSHK